MKKKKWIPLLCLFALLTALATGCGGRDSSVMLDSAETEEASQPSQNLGVSYSSDAAAGDPEPEGEGDGVSSQKLIYTVDLEIETLDYDLSLDTLEQLTATCGGYVEYAQVGDNGINSSGLRQAWYTLRIPVGQLEAFLDSCGSVGQLCSSARQTENRTAEYADLAARVESLRIEEETLQALLAQAQDMESIVALHDRLSELRYEIERIEASLRGIDGLVAYSTVNLSLQEVVVERQTVGPDSGFGERVSARAAETWDSFTAAVQSFGVFLLGELPLRLLLILLWLLPFGIIALIVVLLVRRSRRKRRRQPPAPPARPDGAPETERNE